MEIQRISIPRNVIRDIPPPALRDVPPPVVSTLELPVIDVPNPVIEYPTLDVPTQQEFESQFVQPTKEEIQEAVKDPEPSPSTPRTEKEAELENLTTEQLTARLDPTVTGASNPAVFNAASAAREEARAAGLPEEEVQRKVLIATIIASESSE